MRVYIIFFFINTEAPEININQALNKCCNVISVAMVTIRTLLMPFPSELHLFRFYSNYFFNSVFVIASTPLALAVPQHQLQKSAGKSSNSAIGPAHRMRCTHKTHRICGFFFSAPVVCILIWRHKTHYYFHESNTQWFDLASRTINQHTLATWPYRRNDKW